MYQEKCSSLDDHQIIGSKYVEKGYLSDIQSDKIEEDRAVNEHCHKFGCRYGKAQTKE